MKASNHTISDLVNIYQNTQKMHLLFHVKW